MRRANGAYVNGAWTRGHHEIIKAAAQDPRTSRIFVFPGAKVQMCDDERGDRSYLRKIRPWYGHHYHFHIRLACPAGAQGCVDQAVPPPGDGCDDAREWQSNIISPPKAKPAPEPEEPATPREARRELVLADLPLQCKAVLDAN
jgi:penicillin-insensitive murein endopeptidase